MFTWGEDGHFNNGFNMIIFSNYRHDESYPNTLYIDDVVVSTSYIGPQVGISEENRELIYNNPFRIYMGNKFITFYNISSENIVKIFDVSGKLIHNSGNITNNIYKWNVNNMSSGIYFYKIVGEHNINGKVVIIR